MLRLSPVTYVLLIVWHQNMRATALCVAATLVIDPWSWTDAFLCKATSNPTSQWRTNALKAAKIVLVFAYLVFLGTSWRRHLLSESFLLKQSSANVSGLSQRLSHLAESVSPVIHHRSVSSGGCVPEQGMSGPKTLFVGSVPTLPPAPPACANLLDSGETMKVLCNSVCTSATNCLSCKAGYCLRIDSFCYTDSTDNSTRTSKKYSSFDCLGC